VKPCSPQNRGGCAFEIPMYRAAASIKARAYVSRRALRTPYTRESVVMRGIERMLDLQRKIFATYPRHRSAKTVGAPASDIKDERATRIAGPASRLGERADRRALRPKASAHNETHLPTGHRRPFTRR